MNSGVPGQNGIWVKFLHFWPKNDDEKWSRKNIFKNPPCSHHVTFINDFLHTDFKVEAVRCPKDINFVISEEGVFTKQPRCLVQEPQMA